MAKRRLIAPLLPLCLALTSCISVQATKPQPSAGFDIVGFLKNPVVMLVIAIIVLWFAFRTSKS